MTQMRPLETSSASGDIGRVIQDDHNRILALYRLYLDSPPDSRRTVVDGILHQLTLHLDKEERLLQGFRMPKAKSRRTLGDVELEHEKVKVMILELQQSEADDDQALDEFFEDMMQSVQALFMIEERDLLPLIERSWNA